VKQLRHIWKFGDILPISWNPAVSTLVSSPANCARSFSQCVPNAHDQPRDGPSSLHAVNPFRPLNPLLEDTPPNSLPSVRVTPENGQRPDPPQSDMMRVSRARQYEPFTPCPGFTLFPEKPQKELSDVSPEFPYPLQGRTVKIMVGQSE
jgi:hypothetical protein